MIVYKACSIRNGRIESWSSLAADKKTYGLNQTTVPRDGCGPLAAFKTLEEAVKFVRINGSLAWFYPIFKCVAKKSKRDCLYNGYSTCKFTPDNTVFCESIKLIKLMKGGRQ